MESVDAKIARAREHADAFHREALDFTKATKRHIVLKTNPEQTSAWLVCWCDDPYPPIRLSVRAGECAYNLKSALDNLICGLIRRTQPTSKCRGRWFPIRTDESKYRDERDSALKGIPEDAKKAVDALQPWQRPPASAAIDPLNILHTLANRDKHQAANLMSGYSRNTKFAIHANDGRIHYVVTSEPLFGESSEVIPLDLDPATIHPSARVESMGTTVIAFRDEGPWSDRSVSDVLTACTRYVEEHVLPRFRPFFS